MNDVMTSQDVEVQKLVTVTEEQTQGAEQRVDEASAVDRALVAQLVAGAREQGLDLAGENGLLGQLTKLVLESALEGEITDHLGYEPHERGGSAEGNSRNGTRSKTVLTKAGPVAIEVPREKRRDLRAGHRQEAGAAAGQRGGHGAVAVRPRADAR